MDPGFLEPNLDADALIRIVRDVPVGITVMDPSGGIVFANNQARRLLMVESEQIPAEQVRGFLARHELFDEDGRPIGPGDLPSRRALAGEEVPEKIIAYRRKGERETRAVRLRSVPMFDRFGRVRFAINVWSEVTDLLQVRDELRIRSRLLETETESSVQGILHASELGEVVSVNQRLCEMLERPRAELVGQPEHEVLSWFCSRAPHGLLARAVRRGRLPRRETHWRVVRDDHRSFELRMVPLLGDDEQDLGRLWFFEDITRQRQTERARRQVLREHKGRMAAESGQRRSAFLSEVGRLLGSNLDAWKALESVARLSVPLVADLCVIDVVEGSTTLRRVAATSGTPALAPWAEALRVSLATNEGDAPLQRALRQRTRLIGRISTPEEPFGQAPSTGPLAGQYVVAPLLGHDELLGAVTFLYLPPRALDSELALIDSLVARMSAALDNAGLYLRSLEAVRARDEFLAIAAHELRTPVTALQFALQLLERALPKSEGGEKARHSTEVALRQGRRLTKLIENLLDLSRIHAGKLSLNLEPVDLRALAEDVVDRFQPEILAAGCSLELDAPEPVHGVWDRVRLEQILANLISNAIKYGAGHPVQLELRAQNGRARLTVVDHGIGIQLSEQSRLFGKFERLVSARHYGGLGLGLFITRQLVQALGGAIAVESEEGRGSTFTVELPVQATQPVPVPDLPPP